MSKLEDKSYIQEESIKDEPIFRINIDNSLPWILGVVSIIVMIVASSLTIVDGEVQFTYQKLISYSWWIITIIKSACGILFTMSLKKYGINKGNKIEENVRLKEEYRSLLSVAKPETKPRSLKEFQKSGTLSGGMLKITIAICLAIISGGEMFQAGFDLKGLIMAFVSLGIWVAFGLMTLSKTYEYMKEELPEWYIEQIRIIKDKQKVIESIGLSEIEVRFALSNLHNYYGGK